MQVFTCQTCLHPVYFDNFQCTSCGAKLAFLPELGQMSVLSPQRGASDRYTAAAAGTKSVVYRMCQNAVDFAACNWAVRDDEGVPYCKACRLNGTIPNLSDEQHKVEWLRLEAGKRRLIYALISLGLPVESRTDDPKGGLQFDFLASTEGQPVFTGHSDGLITINVAEADDPFREKTRENMGERYRTVLGHFRHEIGHYYWNRLIADSPRLTPFRALFGDEQQSYEEAVKRHYEQGAPADWQNRFISAYATMHPWEDWAETWAHYMHMHDVLETAGAYGVSLAPRPVGGGKLPEVHTAKLAFADFEAMQAAFVPLTLALNSLSRSMGHADAYPFVLSTPALEKLRFVHETVREAGAVPVKKSGWFQTVAKRVAPRKSA